MKKRFIISLDSSTPEQDKAFVAYLKDHGVGWWHWMTNLWLVANSSGDMSASKLRTDLRQIYPGVHIIVFEFSDSEDTWAGFGPNGEKRNMFNWIRENWDKD